MANTEDENLLVLIQNPASRNQGYAELVRLYGPRLYHNIRRMVITHEDTNDILQLVFIKAWQNIGSFRGESKLFTWLYRIAMNESLNFLRKQKQVRFVPVDGLSVALENSTDFTGEEIQRKLLYAMMKLPEKQRAVFNMKYFDELKYEEIAEITGTSVGALKASYHLAVRKIEEMLQAD